MPALRVPCDARMNRRDVKLANAQTVTSRTLRLILCFSASLNVRLTIKDEELKTKEKPFFVIAPFGYFLRSRAPKHGNL